MMERRGIHRAGFAVGLIVALSLTGSAGICEEGSGSSKTKEKPFSLQPRLLHSDAGDGYTFALRAKGGMMLKWRQDENTGGRSAFFSARFDATVATDKDRNPDNLLAEAGGGLVFNTYRPGEFGDLDPEDPDAGMPKKARDWGRFDFALKARFESDQALDEQDILVGLETGYVHTSKPLIPSLVVAYEWANSVESELRDSLGLQDDSYSRLRVALSWHLLFSEVLPKRPAWQPVDFHADLRHFELIGLEQPLEVMDLDDATYLALSVSYSLASRKPEWLDQVFVRYSDGRLPPNLATDQSWGVGIVLGKLRK